MSFFVFKLIFYALALALVVTIGLIARQLLRKRRAEAPAPPTKRPRPILPRVAVAAARKADDPPEDSAGEAPALPRRRQLRSLSEVEAQENGGSPIALETVTASETVTAVETLAASETSPAPEAPPPGFSTAMIAKLEEAFEQLQQDRITLQAYTERVLAEKVAVEQQLASEQARGDDGQESLAAQEAINWCLDWADERGRHRQGQ